MRNFLLPADAEKRASALVVSRYGVSQALVQKAAQALVEARAQGKSIDLLDMMVSRKLLTRAQADELRFDLDPHLDSTLLAPGPGGKPPANAADKPDGPKHDVDIPATASGYRLRSLGEFRLLRRLGEGGMGAVYLGYQEGQDRKVAIKVLADQLAKNQAYIDRFQREASSGLVLDHPNIVHCFTAGRDPASGKYYLVLEFVDGPNARALLERFGRLPVGDAVHMALDIARGLEHIHSRNFVHRDIKPDNIFITQSGLAKLGDLGLAKRMNDSTTLTAARQGVGTPYYMPYEQVINAKQVDGRCDIYALGATLYHLVTGEVPFPGKSAIEIAEKKLLGTFTPAGAINPDVPPVLDCILEKMMALYPRDRYQTASEVIVDLERANLAAPVPSFIDPDAALRDPLVRARLTSPAQPTVLDLGAPQHQERAANCLPLFWHLRYRDRHGQLRKAKATTEQIVERLQGNRLPPGIEACPQADGQFRPLSWYPEFRHAKTEPDGDKAKDSPDVPLSQFDFQTAVPIKREMTGVSYRHRLGWLLAVAMVLGFLALILGIVFILLQ